jgi:hypothetical protein
MMVSESDKQSKVTKEEKLRGSKKSLIEETFGSYYISTGKKYLLSLNLSNLVLCLDCLRVSRTREATLDMSVTISFKSDSSSLKEGELRRLIEKRAAESKQKDMAKKDPKSSTFMKLVRYACCRCSE